MQSIYEIAHEVSAYKSANHLPIYERLFEPMRTQRLALLELGVFNGGSLKMWETFFPNALIAGVDLTLPPVTFGARTCTFEGNQADPAVLSRAAQAAGPDGFDIIIDDCAHIGVIAKASFCHLFDNHLKPGGLYAIEDWGTGYWQDWSDGSRFVQQVDTLHRLPSHDAGMVGFVKQLVDECHVDAIREGQLAPVIRASKFASMSIYAGLVVIEKAK